MAILTGGNIANIERVKITTIETTPKTYIFETATSATFTSVVEAGAEVKLRVKNTIHGLIKTDTLVTGYDVEVQDQTLLMEVFALIDGGTYTKGDGETGERYAAPVAGKAVERTPFDLSLYTSDRGNDGNARAFHEWQFPNCKGKPVDGAFKDGEFATNGYKLESRPATGISPMSVERIQELPSVA